MTLGCAFGPTQTGGPGSRGNRAAAGVAVPNELPAAAEAPYPRKGEKSAGPAEVLVAEAEQGSVTADRCWFTPVTIKHPGERHSRPATGGVFAAKIFPVEASGDSAES